MAIFNIGFRKTDIYLWENINDFLFKLIILHFCRYAINVNLFLLEYWSCLFEAFCSSNNLASRFLHFVWSLIFSSLSASIIESFNLDMLSVTISCTDFVKFSLISFSWSLISLNLLSVLCLISLNEDSNQLSSLVFLALHLPMGSCG